MVFYEKLAIMWYVSVSVFSLVAAADNYCSVCRQHTMCIYQGIGRACGGNVDRGVSRAEADQIVQWHNIARSRIASGEETRGSPGPQPAAANMLGLVWDNNLAEVAQRWADQCTFQHDQCRDDPRFKVGQNIYWNSGYSNVDWGRAIQSWYDELTLFNGRSVGSYQFASSTGHYTQMMWAKTRYVGCGRTSYGASYRVDGSPPVEYVLSASGNDTESEPVEVPLDFDTESDEPVKRRRRTIGFAGYDRTVPDPAAGVGVIPGLATGNGNYPTNSGQRYPGQSGPAGAESAGDADQTNGPDRCGAPPAAGSTPGATGTNSVIRSVADTVASLMKALLPARSPVDAQGRQAAGTGNCGEASTNTQSPKPIIPTVPRSPFPVRRRVIVPKKDGKLPEYIQLHTLRGGKWVPINYRLGGNNQLMVCNYGSSGNILGQPIYNQGQPCSQCPQGTYCQNNLCF